MKIVKNSGEVVAFNADKLKMSLLRSGADETVADDIIETIKSQLYNGISTRHIYKTAMKMLRKVSASHAARYNLRAAIRQLGPAGFFFEKFVSLLFKSEGCQTRLNLTLQGKCVTHEIDVVLQSEDILTMVECKFHGRPETASDVKTPMYILSRFNDIKDRDHRIFSSADKIQNCLIVTNNRFTTDAMTFATCSGLELLAWDYPMRDCLKTKIDATGLYPVTCLTTLTLLEKEKLLFLEIILARQLVDSPEALDQIGIGENRKIKIIQEAAVLCKIFIA